MNSQIKQQQDQQQDQLHLVAFKLCPYVQRSVITLEEKGIPYQRTDIDLAHKPDWFKKLSPTGKVPLLILKPNGQQEVLFESAVICEYLDEITPGSLLQQPPLGRAQDRSWIEFSTLILNHIGKLYNAKDKTEFDQIQAILAEQFSRLDKKIAQQAQAAYFNGENFSLVDAAFAPVFRYFEVFEHDIEITCFKGLSAIQHWRKELANRPSVQKAVSEDYHPALVKFVQKKESYLGRKLSQ